MITVVDKAGDQVVQKVTKPNGALVRYQVVTNGIFDASQTKVFVDLESARHAIGKANNGKSINLASA